MDLTNKVGNIPGEKKIYIVIFVENLENLFRDILITRLVTI